MSARPTDVGREAVVRAAGTAYFDVMRIPVRRRPVVRPARQLFGSAARCRERVDWPKGCSHSSSRSAVRSRLAATAQVAEIIGVVGEVKHRALDETASPTVYLSALQSPSRSSNVVVRSARPDADVIAAVREEVARLDRDLPVYAVRSMQDVVAASPGVPARRVLTATFTGFALLAVVLGGIGLFGVVGA